MPATIHRKRFQPEILFREVSQGEQFAIDVSRILRIRMQNNRLEGIS